MNDYTAKIIGALISGLALLYMTCSGGTINEDIFIFWSVILFLSILV